VLALAFSGVPQLRAFGQDIGKTSGQPLGGAVNKSQSRRTRNLCLFEHISPSSHSSVLSHVFPWGRGLREEAENDGKNAEKEKQMQNVTGTQLSRFSDPVDRSCSAPIDAD